MTTTLATEHFQHIAGARAQAAVQALTSSIDGCRDEKAMLAILGVPESLRDDPAQVEAATLRLALANVSAIITSSVGAKVSPADLARLGASDPVHIRVTATPERVISNIFENGSPEFVGTFFAEPGAVEAICAEASTMTVIRLPDGSCFLELVRDDNSNLATRKALHARARSIFDMSKAEDAQPLLDAYVSAVEPLAQEQGLSPAARSLVKGLAEEAALDTLRSLGTFSAPSTLPLDTQADFSKALKAYVDGNQWKSGVTVEVAGAPCPSPAALLAAAGFQPALPPISLAEALARRAKPAEAPSPAASARRKPRG